MLNELTVLAVTSVVAVILAVGTVGPFLSLVFLLWRWRVSSQIAKRDAEAVSGELEPAAGLVA